MNNTTHIIGAALLALALAGCSGTNDFKPVAGMNGAEIFANACASCHGDGGNGKFGFLLKLKGDADLSAEEVTEKILKGGSLMPAFQNITQQEAESVAAYLLAPESAQE
jgi:mono/diheme cytochrome c family protein